MSEYGYINSFHPALVMKSPVIRIPSKQEGEDRDDMEENYIALRENLYAIKARLYWDLRRMEGNKSYPHIKASWEKAFQTLDPIQTLLVKIDRKITDYHFDDIKEGMTPLLDKLIVHLSELRREYNQSMKRKDIFADYDVTVKYDQNLKGLIDSVETNAKSIKQHRFFNANYGKSLYVQMTRSAIASGDGDDFLNRRSINVSHPHPRRECQGFSQAFLERRPDRYPTHLTVYTSENESIINIPYILKQLKAVKWHNEFTLYGPEENYKDNTYKFIDFEAAHMQDCSDQHLYNAVSYENLNQRRSGIKKIVTLKQKNIPDLKIFLTIKPLSKKPGQQVKPTILNHKLPYIFEVAHKEEMMDKKDYKNMRAIKINMGEILNSAIISLDHIKLKCKVEPVVYEKIQTLVTELEQKRSILNDFLILPDNRQGTHAFIYWRNHMEKYEQILAGIEAKFQGDYTNEIGDIMNLIKTLQALNTHDKKSRFQTMSVVDLEVTANHMKAFDFDNQMLKTARNNLKNTVGSFAISWQQKPVSRPKSKFLFEPKQPKCGKKVFLNEVLQAPQMASIVIDIKTTKSSGILDFSQLQTLLKTYGDFIEGIHYKKNGSYQSPFNSDVKIEYGRQAFLAYDHTIIASYKEGQLILKNSHAQKCADGLSFNFNEGARNLGYLLRSKNAWGQYAYIRIHHQAYSMHCEYSISIPSLLKQ